MPNVAAAWRNREIAGGVTENATPFALKHDLQGSAHEGPLRRPFVVHRSAEGVHAFRVIAPSSAAAPTATGQTDDEPALGAAGHGFGDFAPAAQVDRAHV